MESKKDKKSTVRSIVAEIAHDLGIDKKLVRQVLLLTFKEIAVTLILRGRPVMIRRFVKFVVAMSAANKMRKDKLKKETK